MSGDLISRKETERILREYADDVGCNRGEYEMANGILKAVCCMNKPENVPTAYDVEEVIHQLEDAIMPTPEHKHKFCGTVQPEDCVKYDNCEDCMAEKMIEIVKSGGTAVGQKGIVNE